MRQARSSRHQTLKRHPINMKLTYTIPSNDPSRQKQLNENLNYPFFVYGNRSTIKAISKLVWGHVTVSLFPSSDMVDTNSDFYQTRVAPENSSRTKTSLPLILLYRTTSTVTRNFVVTWLVTCLVCGKTLV
jgi:hypothetical protein